MPMNGNITSFLEQRYRDKGYMLSEDEDFFYLYVPGDENPLVFSKNSTTVEKINTYIANLEKKEAIK